MTILREPGFGPQLSLDKYREMLGEGTREEVENAVSELVRDLDRFLREDPEAQKLKLGVVTTMELNWNQVLVEAGIEGVDAYFLRRTFLGFPKRKPRNHPSPDTLAEW